VHSDLDQNQLQNCPCWEDQVAVCLGWQGSIELVRREPGQLVFKPRGSFLQGLEDLAGVDVVRERRATT
jgi:hypothetical protein